MARSMLCLQRLGGREPRRRIRRLRLRKEPLWSGVLPMEYQQRHGFDEKKGATTTTSRTSSTSAWTQIGNSGGVGHMREFLRGNATPVAMAGPGPRVRESVLVVCCDREWLLHSDALMHTWCTTFSIRRQCPRATAVRKSMLVGTPGRAGRTLCLHSVTH